MQYNRMPIEVESPEELGYNTIKYNLAESSFSDRKLSELGIQLDDALLAYQPHRGDDALRQEIIKENSNLLMDDVLTTSGAIMALFIIHTTLLQKGDHIIVVRPNYASNLETPRAIGCDISYHDVTMQKGWQIDIDVLKAQIKPSTKLISITTPHNPTGTEVNESTMQDLIQTVETLGIMLLVDETYRELNFNTKLKPYLADQSGNVISVSSLSKAYGVPGIRIGWLITKHKNLMHQFLAAKEQIILSNALIEESIALQILQKRYNILIDHHAALNTNFGIIKNYMDSSNFLEWVEPTAGAVGFAKVKEGLVYEPNAFNHKLYTDFGTLVGYGHWFEMDGRYMRLGFGYPTVKELEQGLDNIENCFSSFSS